MLEQIEPRRLVLPAIAVTGLSAGWLASGLGNATLATGLWWAGTLPILAVLSVQIVRSLLQKDLGLDLIAALSMSSALTIGEPLAANVVALMYAGGGLLEAYAEGRARAEMTALLQRTPRTVLRRKGAALEAVPVDTITAGDVVLVRPGEVVAVDGYVTAAQPAVLDTSSLTGEPVPQRAQQGDDVLSGTTCLDHPFEMVARHAAAQSTYASIVRLVEAAQTRKAPMSRLADRYAIGFFVLTILIAALAWLSSGTAERAVAVLVVATPCPLILGVPVALISGLSRAARSGLLLKSGAVLEQMAKVRTLVIDKTGTLTRGSARVQRIEVVPPFTENEVLRLAASLDQASTHVLSAALAQACADRELKLSSPIDTSEDHGAGIVGRVDQHSVVVGGRSYVERRGVPLDRSKPQPDTQGVTVTVAIDDKLAGCIYLEDPPRPDAAATLADLRSLGIASVILASGDRQAVVEQIGARLALDEVRGDLSPSAKAELIDTLHSRGPVMMVGDGVNDAPALAAADVGVAMGARGSAASTEAADAVVLVDDLRPVAKGMEISRRTIRIAKQSVWAGLGLSLAAMAVAALGYLPPVQGALLQEAIDVAVILNALRALR